MKDLTKKDIKNINLINKKDLQSLKIYFLDYFINAK